MGFELILPFIRPIEPLLLDEEVSEIMGNPDSSWWIERAGELRPAQGIRFDAAPLRTGLEVIANHLGKKLDEDNPLLTAHLPDGRRLAALIQPLVGVAPALTIRKFTSRDYTTDDMIERGTLTRALAEFLREQIQSGKTILISGGTETGNSRFGYIVVSCASHEATIFTDDVNRLDQQLSTKVSKTSAIEIQQSESMAQSVSM